MNKVTINAAIITIGDEILYGHITDTNARFIAEALSNAGISVLKKITVGDNREDINAALEDVAGKTTLVIITGGLGPTKDDITKNTLAAYFHSEIRLHEEALQHLQVFFKRRNWELSATNKTQANLPTTCTYIPNNYGTAPAMWFEEKGQIWVSLPGVPFEMKKVFTEEIIPKLKGKLSCPVITHKIIRTVGIGESFLSDKIADWEQALPPEVKLAYLPETGQVKLRLSISGSSEERNLQILDKEIKELKNIAGTYIYSYENLSLEAAIGKLLSKEKAMLATAESCTGGTIASMITSVPGSSSYFKGSIVAYNNAIKKKLLQVKEATLKVYGAVSEETVSEMAKGVREVLEVDYSLATSGIAGPGGGSEQKPVGTIWIACATKKDIVTQKLALGTDRETNIKRTAVAALNLLRQRIVKKG